MKSIILDKSYLFALDIVRAYKLVVSEKREYVLSKQILRSGTSIGANVREAHNAESDKDFIHKLAIAQKECDETLYWLDLLHDSGYLDKNRYEILSSNCKEILIIIKTIIIKVKKRIGMLPPNY